jgi:hypothetical protein
MVFGGDLVGPPGESVRVFRGASQAECLRLARVDQESAIAYGYEPKSQTWSEEAGATVLTVTYRVAGIVPQPNRIGLPSAPAVRSAGLWTVLAVYVATALILASLGPGSACHGDTASAVRLWIASLIIGLISAVLIRTWAPRRSDLVAGFGYGALTGSIVLVVASSLALACIG